MQRKLGNMPRGHLQAVDNPVSDIGRPMRRSRVLHGVERDVSHGSFQADDAGL